ncbi:MAG: twitching motility protein PilT [Pyrinomonadaceae bacterium]|nr:twitching motility protein PilT [Pyrinomonadaceae bacterium]
MSANESSLTDQLSLSDLLKKLIEMGGSDLHLTTNTPPQVRVDGGLKPLEGFKTLTSADTKQLAYSVLTDAQKHRFEESLELDFSFGVRGLSRFRANLFNQRGAVGCVFRAIPYEIRSFENLGLPPVVTKLCDKPRGLILVTGPTGSGKSTTLAAMIDKINRERHEHIMTIEDPIEFLHNHKSCVVNQREVGSDTKGFAEALRTALRQDPDVVLVGEMRDLETIESALRIAETGHLTFATLHTNSAASTINRIIDVFPSNQQAQIRAQLSLVLEGIMCQALLPKADGRGRVAALEILVPNAAIRNLIREDKVHQIYSMMQTGQEKYGMQTFNQALATLYHKRLISLDLAMQRSSNTDELRELIEHGSGVNGGNGNGANGQPPRPGAHPSPYAQARPIGARPTR